MIQAVFLAGGLGERLLPITKIIPKVLVPVHGRPYLEYKIDILKNIGVKNFLILTGHLGKQIHEYFDDGKERDIRITYSHEERPLGTGGALRYAEDKLEDEFLLFYGDVFQPLNYVAFIDAFRSSGKEGMLAAYDNSISTGIKNNLCIGEDNTIVKYEKESDASDLTHVESGAHAFKKSVLQYIEKDRFVSLELEVYPKLVSQRKLGAFTTDERFIDIGTPERLRQASEYFLNKF